MTLFIRHCSHEKNLLQVWKARTNGYWGELSARPIAENTDCRRESQKEFQWTRSLVDEAGRLCGIWHLGTCDTATLPLPEYWLALRGRRGFYVSAERSSDQGPHHGRLRHAHGQLCKPGQGGQGALRAGRRRPGAGDPPLLKAERDDAALRLRRCAQCTPPPTRCPRPCYPSPTMPLHTHTCLLRIPRRRLCQARCWRCLGSSGRAAAASLL